MYIMVLLSPSCNNIKEKVILKKKEKIQIGIDQNKKFPYFKLQVKLI